MTNNKKRIARFAGFVGALGVSAVLVSTAVSSTGAWFSSSQPGTISASSGHLNLNITDGTSTNLNFAGLMPGDQPTKTINYSVAVSSGPVDLWMTFTPNDSRYLNFTGAKGSTGAPDGGLGGYGYFQVADSNGGTAFTSGNLSFPSTQNTDGSYTPANQTWPTDGSSCSVNANGRGGSSATITGPNQTIPWCGVPAAILLASNLVDTSTGTVTVAFGLDGYKQTQQNQTEFGGAVPFNLVATQHGHRPDAP